MAINRTVLSWSRTIHIYLSIALLIVLGFFSITGITLNHADTMTAVPLTSSRAMDSLPRWMDGLDVSLAESPQLAQFLRQEFGVRLAAATVDEEEGLLFVDYKAPGKSVFVEIDTIGNSLRAETTEYGLVAVLNDLHKARDTNVIWYWFVDASAIFLVIFSMAGFVLLLPNNYRLRRVLAGTAVAAVILCLGYFLGNR